MSNLKKSRPILPATVDRPERIQVALTAVQLLALLEVIDNGEELQDVHMEGHVASAEQEFEEAYTELTGREI